MKRTNKTNKTELRRRLKENAQEEVSLAKEELRLLSEKASELQMLFEVLSQVTTSRRIEDACEAIAYEIECVSSSCRDALEYTDQFSEHEANTLLAVLREKMDISYEEKLL